MSVFSGTYLNFISFLPLNVVMFWIVGLFVVMHAGVCLTKLCGMKDSIAMYYISGCILLMAISHVIARVCSICDTSFLLFKYVTLVTSAIIIVMMTIVLAKKKAYSDVIVTFRNSVNSFWKSSLCEKVLFLIIVGIIGYIILNSLNLRFDASDDGIYVTKVGMMIRDNKLNLSIPRIVNGTDPDSTLARADVSTWCAFLALLASTFGIDYAAMNHLAIVPVVAIGQIAVVSLLGNVLIKNRKNEKLFMIVYLILALTSPYFLTMVLDSGAFAYPWLGCAVIYVLIYMIVYLIYIAWNDDNYMVKMPFWIYTSIVVIASISSEVVAVFLLPCLFLAFGLPYIIKVRKKITVKFLVNLLIVMLPIIVAGISLLWQMNHMPSENMIYSGKTYEAKITEEVSGSNVDADVLSINQIIAEWKSEQKIYWSFRVDNIYAIATLLAVLLIKQKEIRSFFGAGIAIAVLTFLNPLLYRFIYTYVSSQTVYYRLYWCIPNLIIIAYFVVEMIDSYCDGRVRSGLAYISILACMWLSLGNIYDNREMAVNKQKVSATVAAIAEEVLCINPDGEVVVAVEEGIADYLRQYSLNIIFSESYRYKTKSDEYISNAIVAYEGQQVSDIFNDCEQTVIDGFKVIRLHNE